jgi:hypothetical protein
MKRFLTCLAIAVATLSLPSADELELVWRTPDGEVAFHSLVVLPREITRQHIASLSFTAAAEISPHQAASSTHLTLQPLSVEPLQKAYSDIPERSSDSIVPDDIGPDWSGGEIRIIPSAVTTCQLTSGSATGFVTRGQSFVVSATGAMTIVAAVDPLKGDPDLYLVDLFGYDICSSTNLGKTAESCAAIQLSCLNGSLFVEVYGNKRKNSFSLGVWITSAI